MKIWVRIGIIIGLCIPFVGLTNTVIEIQEDFKPLYIGAFLETQVTQETTTLDEIAHLNNWLSQNNPVFISKPTGGCLWVKLKVYNKTSRTKDMALVLEAPLLDQVQFFSFENKVLVDSTLKMGNAFPFEQRAIQHRFPIYSFQLQSFQELIIYGSLLEENRYLPVYLKLYQQDDLIPALQKDIIHKILLIAPIIFLIIIGTLFTCYKPKSYNALFTLVFAGTLFFLLGLEGIGFQYLWPNNLYLQKGYPLFYMLALLFAALNLFYFFKISKYKKLAKLIYLTIGIQLLTIGCAFLCIIVDRLKSVEIIFATSILSSYLLIILFVLLYYKKTKRKPILQIVWMFILQLVIGIFVSIAWVCHFHFQKYLSNFELFSIIVSFQAIFIHLLSLIYFYRKSFAYRKVESQLSETKNEALQNLLKGQEIERKRLSRTLHDGLSIRLLQVKLGLNRMQESLNYDSLPKTLFEINEIHQDIRNISHALNPTVLQEYGLKKAINDIIFNIELNNLDLDIQFEYPNNLSLNKDQAKHFYYIIQELLNNTVKYAKANYVYIELKKMKDRTFFYYYDNGIGYQSVGLSSGIGLQNIKSRVALMNGTFKIIPRKPKGIEHHIYVLHQPMIQSKANHFANGVKI